MVTHKMSGNTATILMSAILFAGMIAEGVDRETKPRTIDRGNASLVKISTGDVRLLKSKSGGKFRRIDYFDDQILSVKTTSPTELEVTALQTGYTLMKATYENGDVEELVYIIEK